LASERIACAPCVNMALQRRRRSCHAGGQVLVLAACAFLCAPLPSSTSATFATASSWRSSASVSQLNTLQHRSLLGADRGHTTLRLAAIPSRRGVVARAASAKELDGDAVSKYAGAVVLQMGAITAFFAVLDSVTALLPEPVPQWAVFVLFFGLSVRSRLFSPLDNSRPDLAKATKGEATGGFNDRTMPSWTPPGITFPIMWILIVAPLRAASSMLVWEQLGHLCDASILTLMLHLSIGDTWNTINNVERRLGAAVPGVLCVWASALFAAYTYYQVVPLAGQLLLPTCLWITVAAALIIDTWRVNNTSGEEPLYPYKGPATTQFWFMAE